MSIRLAFTIVLIITGADVALGQTGPAQQHNDKRVAAPARANPDARPVEQKWVEDSIDKFFAIPNDIFNPPPPRR